MTLADQEHRRMLDVRDGEGEDTPTRRPLSLRDSVRQLRANSGLTWDQLAKLFGVSRRAVHLWASGGRMTASHVDRLARIKEAIDRAPGRTPEEKRESLLSPHGHGRSLFDQLRTEVASHENSISGPAWGPRSIQRLEESLPE